MNGKADKNEPSIMTLYRRIGKKEPKVRKRTDKNSLDFCIKFSISSQS